MKASIAIFFFTFLTSGAVFGQQFAFKGGVNLSTITTKDQLTSITSDRNAKLHIGAFFNHELTREITISPGMEYFGVGSEDATIHYLAIPLMAKYFVSRKFNVHAGPQLNILLGASESDEVINGLRDSNFALAFGAEAFLNEHLGFGGRYIFSVSDMDSESIDITITNTVLQFSVIYFFN